MRRGTPSRPLHGGSAAGRALRSLTDAVAGQLTRPSILIKSQVRPKISAEKDLGILVDMNQQCALAAKAASSMVDSMNRSPRPADQGESLSPFTQQSLDHI
ncbi:hypothetical protein QYF61_018268 [Mycteria americana]|uniref:Uncharacterized protein n=1 Tax=Mycteria americana TaxID=33587 RepID=A0AAN7MS73_MYCAM|nr:hypothetical protein QYF61_018268 [Mycteria americana]